MKAEEAAQQIARSSAMDVVIGMGLSWRSKVVLTPKGWLQHPQQRRGLKPRGSDCSEGGGTGKEKLEGGPGVRSGLC